jgi:hypothetical protein
VLRNVNCTVTLPPHTTRRGAIRADSIATIGLRPKPSARNAPRTRVGAGGFPTEKSFCDAFARLPEVEVLTLDVYDLRNLRICNAMIQTARFARKPVYIEETWRPPLFCYADGHGHMLDPDYNKAVVQAIMRGARTPRFVALKNLVRANRLLPE